MQPTTLNTLKFLANPNTTEKNIIKKLTAPQARFECFGNEGKLAITYPVTYHSYQAGGMVAYPERFFLDDFIAGKQGEWKTEGDTLTRNQFVFERKVVESTFWLTVQTANKSSKAQRIEELVLEYDLLNKLRIAPNTTGLSAKIDICTATNTTTGKIHLLVLSSARANEFTLMSYSDRR